MTQSTTIKPVSKEFQIMFKSACKHAGFKNADLNNPNIQQWIKDQQAKSEEAMEIKATKEYYLQKIAWPFEHYSIYDDDSLKSASFDNYDTSFSKEAKNNYYKAGDIAHQYYMGKEFNTLMLGPCGRGKSHLALSILKSVLKTRKPSTSGIFVDVNEMMQKIKNSFDSKHSIKSIVQQRLGNAYLIVLDDLGAEKISDFDIDVLLGIINSNHRIIFTTNLMPEELRNAYGDRIYSRMRRGVKGHVIQFTDATDDHREVTE